MKQLYIPKNIYVGFQERNNTYTGKLAYVIYTDENGKLRKETSWNRWKSDKIPVEKFDNVPTEGFVLNKTVGGYKSDWNFRQSYVRVYDPRGFEFEITIDNLLFILECAACDPGKGLSGKFVYSWNGSDLVLLPTTAKNYSDIKEYTKKVNNNKIYAKDLVLGNIYIDKKQDRYVYVGRFPYIHYYYEKIPIEEKNVGLYGRRILYNSVQRSTLKGKRYFFVRIYNDNKLGSVTAVTGLRKFIDVEDTPYENYPEVFEKVERSEMYSDLLAGRTEEVLYTKEQILQIEEIITNKSYYYRYIQLKSKPNLDYIKLDYKDGKFDVAVGHFNPSLDVQYDTLLDLTGDICYTNTYLENGKLYSTTNILR